MSVTAEQLGEKLVAYLTNHLGCSIKLNSCERVFGGASKATYRVCVERDGNPWRLICRCAQDSALIETDAHNEFRAYQAFADTEVPTPAPVLEELDSTSLGMSFIVMEEVSGEAASPFHSNPYGAHREVIGKQFWTHLGQIAAHPVEQFADADWPAKPESSWRDALKYWEGVLEQDFMGPQPVISAAQRWLHRNPPAQARQLVLVHGDYRTGNVLTAGDRVTAVLDWEMAHLGDPLEDLAWALSPLWCVRCPQWPAGTLERSQAIALWEKASGFKVDAEALHWWEVFACVKGAAIWTSAGNEFAEQTNNDPINLFSAWGVLPIHEQTIIQLLRGSSNAS